VPTTADNNDPADLAVGSGDGLAATLAFTSLGLHHWREPGTFQVKDIFRGNTLANGLLEP
jgi:hypothetical protein